MKAIIQRTYGPPADVLELEEVAQPVVGDNDVLVEVSASSVAGDDWHLMRGHPYVARIATGLFKPRHRIPGRDVAGRVEAVGRAVTEFRPGDEVFGWCDGGLAEYVSVPEDALMPKPLNLTLHEAAAVPGSGFTALQAVRDKGAVRPGASVLVIGASGGVGTLAVQIAKASGAEVTGVCSTANVALVESLGADRVIDYTSEDFAANGPQYDAILDMVGNRSLGDLKRSLHPTGALVMVGGSGGRWLKGTDRFLKGLVLSVISPQALLPLIHRDSKEDLAALHELIEAGKLRPVVSARYPLSEIGDAIRHFAHGHARGKVIVTVSDSSPVSDASGTPGLQQVAGE